MNLFPIYNLAVLLVIGIFLSLFGFILDGDRFQYVIPLCGAVLIGHSIVSSVIFSQKKWVSKK